MSAPITASVRRRPFSTGDANADKLLEFIAAYAAAVPRHLQEYVRGGWQAMPFNYRYLVGQTHLDSVQVREALEYLHEHEYLRVDCEPRRWDGSPNAYGVYVWLGARLEAA